MVMSRTLSKYKYKRIATESFKNGLRLHFDSILLYTNGSFPSSFQLSVLAMEEFSKSDWVEHYYWSSITNMGFPDADFEQEWLKLLFLHPKKQNFFFHGMMHLEYSPRFVEFVQNKQLEIQKQRATYVGLDRNKGNIDIESRISIPNRIKGKDAKSMVSMLNDYLKEICERKLRDEWYFDIEEKDELITEELLERLKGWKFRSGIKSNRWFEEWRKREKLKTKSQHA